MVTKAVKVEKVGLRSATAKAKRKQTSSIAIYQRVNERIVKANPNERISMIRGGLDVAMLAGGSEFFNIPSNDFLRIVGVPVSTASRKKRENATLSMAASERLARIALIESEAEDIFGSQEVATQWLTSRNHALGDAPLTLLDTEIGANEVKKVLTAIAYGGAV